MGVTLIVEMADLCSGEVIRDLRQDREKVAVGDCSNPFYFFLVIADAVKMRQHTGEILPTMKRFRIDQQALQFTVFLDIWLDQQPEALEVIGLQQYPPVLQQVCPHHAIVGL